MTEVQMNQLRNELRDIRKLLTVIAKELEAHNKSKGILNPDRLL